MSCIIPSPEDIKKQLDQATENLVAKIVPQLVDELRRNYSGNSMLIHMDEYTLSPKARECIFSLFYEAGWLVEYKDPEKKGNALLISPRPKT